MSNETVMVTLCGSLLDAIDEICTLRKERDEAMKERDRRRERNLSLLECKSRNVQALGERDEARETAQRLLEAVDYRDYRLAWHEDPDVLIARCPWLIQPLEPTRQPFRP